MLRDSACVFCKIVALEIPAAVVYEDDSVLAFLDVGPLADGHLLLIPRAHHSLLVDLPAADCARLVAVLPALGRALLEVTDAGGFNVLMNNGKVAGQVVPHVHVHLIPRREDDQLGYRWNAGSYPAGRAEELAQMYKQTLRVKRA